MCEEVINECKRFLVHTADVCNALRCLMKHGRAKCGSVIDSSPCFLVYSPPVVARSVWGEIKHYRSVFVYQSEQQSCRAIEQ